MRDLPDLAPLIDHALLDPHQGLEAVQRACDQARHFGFAGVCLASRWLPAGRERLGASGGRGPRLISVVGFPFGAVPAEIKRNEAEWAAAAGAEELDVVPDFGALADGDSRSFCNDLAPIVELGLPVKVILDVGRLRADALALAVEASIDVGVTMLKTGSGFGPGATVEQVRQLRSLARGRAAVKAAGGITDLEQALALVEAGASRLGTSRGVALIEALRRGPETERRQPEPPEGEPA
ncbi:MAG: deoxyribose-phosphate aldolase [Cyanobacteriota bacterium]